MATLGALVLSALLCESCALGPPVQKVGEAVQDLWSPEVSNNSWVSFSVENSGGLAAILGALTGYDIHVDVQTLETGARVVKIAGGTIEVFKAMTAVVKVGVNTVLAHDDLILAILVYGAKSGF